MKKNILTKTVLHKSRRSEQGVIAVEFALLISLVISMMIVTVDVSALWRVDTLIHEAARQGARVASKTSGLQIDDSEPMDVIDTILQNSGIPLGAYTASVRYSGASISAGEPVTVQVEYLFTPPLTGGWTPGIGGPYLLSRSVVMRYEVAG